MSVVWKIVFAGDRYGYLNNWLLGIGAIEEPTCSSPSRPPSCP